METSKIQRKHRSSSGVMMTAVPLSNNDFYDISAPPPDDELIRAHEKEVFYFNLHPRLKAVEIIGLITVALLVQFGESMVTNHTVISATAWGITAIGTFLLTLSVFIVDQAKLISSKPWKGYDSKATQRQTHDIIEWSFEDKAVADYRNAVTAQERAFTKGEWLAVKDRMELKGGVSHEK